MDEEAGPTYNDAVLDQMLMNFNKDHLQEQLRTASSHNVSYHECTGPNYVLQRILGHAEIDSYERQESRVNLAAII